MNYGKLVWPALLCVALTQAWATEDSDGGCGHTIASVPQSVLTILGPIYTGANDESGLADASANLQTLMREANACRLFVMSSHNTSESKQRDIMEWQSLNQWLTRLANFTELNAKGHSNVDWRDEYEIFAELYEMEI